MNSREKTTPANGSNHVLGNTFPMRKLTAHDIAERDAKLATLETRARLIAACVSDKCVQGRRPCPQPSACVVHLDNTLAGRAVRAIDRFVAWALRWEKRS